MIDDDFELPELPVIDKGPPPECPMCGDPMGFIDGDWCCMDCNGELIRAGNRLGAAMLNGEVSVLRYSAFSTRD